MAQTFSIDDYGLSADHLEDKYDNADDTGEHPTYSTWDWTQVVAQRSTRLGYWAWVKAQLEAEEDRYYRQASLKKAP
jgi:hypothetical protein